MTGVRWSEWIQPGDVVIDVGANTGKYTKAFAEAVGPTGRVIAFEPDAEIAQSCKHYCNGATWVDVRAQAVGQTSGVSAFYRGVGPQQSTRYAANVGREAPTPTQVPTVTLDDAVKDLPIAGIKVDAQGDDGWVMAGARETVARMKPGSWVLLEIWPEGMRAAGYALQELGPQLAGWHLIAEGKGYIETTRTLAALLADAESWAGGKHTNVLLRKGT